MKILIFTLLTVEISFAQDITEPTAKESDCFGEILTGNCSETNTRAYVKQVNAGVKYLDRYTGNDSCSPSFSAPRECCIQESDDCHGEYIAVTTDPYSYHKDCIGKNKCSARQATRMDTLYLTSCNQNLYPLQTTYMDVEFYCIDVNNITPLNNGNKQNNGQGSTLYLWSGDTSTYSELTVATHTCSVETDCDGKISVLSLDFRFAPDNVNVTCIEDNMLSIKDESNTNHFNCSSNNNFEIKTLYTSHSNYITVTYTGTNAGGYLWLGFQTSTNGNLTINCQSPGQIYTCEISTTEEPTTTEQETTTQQTTTPEATTSLQSTTNEATTGSLTSTEDQTFTTDNSSTTTDKETSGKSESPSAGNNTAMIAGILVAIIIIIVIVIGVGVLYQRHRKKQALAGQNTENQPQASENSRENAMVIDETQGENSTVLSNENEVNRGNNMVHNLHLPSELTGPDTGLTQLPPLTAKFSQNQSEFNEKIKKKKKKKKKKKHNKVDDNGIEIQGNGVLQGSGADIETIDENGKHSRKREKKKKKTKQLENSAELNTQEYFEETPEPKEKKKKKKKRKKRQSDDSKQEEENTTIKTQTTEEKENDTE
ncbi:uncharacterized protein LOC143047876 [Mytilus galloprovincialis]|uniref:uncharacterized protein LOC143047876 n=1 Tax=Mytilus galloprovincialis TaxID=29158 RepID=UPI003F7B3A45